MRTQSISGRKPLQRSRRAAGEVVRAPGGEGSRAQDLFLRRGGAPAVVDAEARVSLQCPREAAYSATNSVGVWKTASTLFPSGSRTNAA
jgi:hypothetical protein